MYILSFKTIGNIYYKSKDKENKNNFHSHSQRQTKKGVKEHPNLLYLLSITKLVLIFKKSKGDYAQKDHK